MTADRFSSRFSQTESTMAPQANQIAIIADDMTGCNDAAAPFAMAGAATQAFVSPEGMQYSAARVVSVSTNSRADEPDIASHKVAAVCQDLRSTGVTHVFKKIDSTGSGNIGTEIEAVLLQTEASVAIVCPAFPDQGRRFIKGVIRTTDTPSVCRDLRSVIAQQTELPMKLVTQPQVHKLLSQGMTSDILDQDEKQVWLVDAAQEEHLDLVAQLVDRLGSRALAVGSSGLARALAKRWIGQQRDQETIEPWEKPPGFFVAIVGSTNDVTKRQLRYLHDTFGGTSLELRRGIDLAKYSDPDCPLVILNKWGPTRCDALNKVLDWIRERSPGTMLLSGGDTAHFVCETAGTGVIAIQGEVASGIPWGIALDGDLKGCHIVTKAGGFGAPSVIANIFIGCGNSSSRNISELER